MDQINNKLDDNITITKDILNLLDNKKTNVVIDEDIKNSYYVFFKDIIYLSNNNNTYKRVCLIAHECIHSIQNKILQKVNFILSNIELIFFVFLFIFLLFSSNNNLPIVIAYVTINILSMVVRFILEAHATIGSVNLSKRYLSTKLETNDLDLVIKDYRNKIIMLFPVFLINLFLFKILRIVLILFMK
ncbi:MAG: hypothetical protein RSC92_05695 [Clostridia bacterium]